MPGTTLKVGDRVVVEAGEVIPGDGDIVEGIATVDESAITGESAPVIRESGGDRSSVTGGTTVLSDRIVVKITAAPGESFVDRMIALVEGAQRQKTPNEIALTILLAALTIIFLLTVVALQPMAGYSGAQQSLVVLTALLVCLIPTTIGALLSAIGIAGMDRLVQRNVLATSGRAVEAAGDVDTLLLDKTGTITFGNRRATELIPAPGVQKAELAAAARLSSLADQTPEGRSIVELCAAENGLPAEATPEEATAEFVPFTAQTRMSGLNVDGRAVRKGAGSAVASWLAQGRARRGHGDHRPDRRRRAGRRWSSPSGRTEPRGCSASSELSDVVKPGMAERFAEMRAMGIRTVMITGDNPLTAKAIAGAGRRRRLPRRGHTRGQDGADPQGAGGRAAGRDDRRRHERRARARPGRRRGRDEHRHGRREGGRQHGRPRLRPDQAHRHRRDRQAAAHHPRRADHVLGGQRPGQVLRDPAGHVRRALPVAGRAQHHAAGDARSRRSSPRSSSTR